MQEGVQSADLDKGCAGVHPRSRRLDATGTPSVLFRDRKHSQDLGVDGRTAAIYRKLLRHNVCAFGLLEKENARIIVPLPASIYQGYRSLSWTASIWTLTDPTVSRRTSTNQQIPNLRGEGLHPRLLQLWKQNKSRFSLTKRGR